MQPETVRVDVVYEERYWYPDDGGVVWIAGYSIVDPESGRFIARDDPALTARGLKVAGVAGAGPHHAEALESEDVGPGRALELRRDRLNPHDPNAIAVHATRGEPAGRERSADRPFSGEQPGGVARAGGKQVGWVPRDLAAELAPELDAGRHLSAVILREQRRSPREPRTGLTMLLARAATIELVMSDRAARSPTRRGHT